MKNYFKLYVKHQLMRPRKHLIFMIGFSLYQIKNIKPQQEDILLLDQAFTLMEHRPLSM